MDHADRVVKHVFFLLGRSCVRELRLDARRRRHASIWLRDRELRRRCRLARRRAAQRRRGRALVVHRGGGGGPPPPPPPTRAPGPGARRGGDRTRDAKREATRKARQAATRKAATRAARSPSWYRTPDWRAHVRRGAARWVQMASMHATTHPRRPGTKTSFRQARQSIGPTARVARSPDRWACFVAGAGRTDAADGVGGACARPTAARLPRRSSGTCPTWIGAYAVRPAQRGGS